ncbi:MAG: 3'-5' exonuclease [Bacteroidetes bacterium]|nr:3'-5' exonuclease [Bacteroidota bacterium]
MQLNLTKPLAFIDLETTGINVTNDRIVEICILRVNTDHTEKILTRRVNPTIPIPEEVVKIHGITNEDVKNEPTFAQLGHELAEFLNGCDLAGYNSINFDIPLLMEEFLRAGIPFELKGRKLVDIQNIFHKMEPRNLRAALRFYCHKELENAHSAEADTIATFEILKAQIERYKDTEYTDRHGRTSKPVQNDIKALSDFSYNNRNVDLVGFIIYNDKKQMVFNFGKHKGKVVEEVFEREPSYFDWIMKSEFPLTTKKVVEAIRLKGFNKGSATINLFSE